MTDTTDIKALLEKINTQTNSYDTVIIRDFEAKQLIAAFEAERQRADKAEADMQFECDAHIDTAESWREWKLRAITAAEEIAALKAKLANPVVLPELCSVVEGEYADSPQITPDPDGYLFYSHKVIESIIIAGFTVKE